MRAVGLAIALVFGGCAEGVYQESHDSVGSERSARDADGLGPNGEWRIDAEQQDKFATFQDLRTSFLVWLDTAANLQKTSSVRYPYCIYTEDIPRDPAVEAQVLEWSTLSVNIWIAALVGQTGWKVTHADAYQVASGTTCPASVDGLKPYVIRINGMSGANNHVANLNMNMGTWGVHKLAVTHEMGHGLGLADTYGWEGRKPVGQPPAVMNNTWIHNNVLQPDDIAGIRFAWQRIRGATGERCPSDYVVGLVELGGKPVDIGSWQETFCVPLERDPRGRYQRTPAQSGWHSGTITMDNKRLRWVNDAGRSWDLIPDFANGLLRTGPDCPYYGSALGNAFELVVQSDKVTGFKFLGELYALDANADACPQDPVKTQAGVCGCGVPDADANSDGFADCLMDPRASFRRTPVANSWHTGRIEQDGAGYRWTNSAGASWKLTPDIANSRLLTGADCPYYNWSQGDAFQLVLEAGRVVGFRFLGELYAR